MFAKLARSNTLHIWSSQLVDNQQGSKLLT